MRFSIFTLSVALFLAPVLLHAQGNFVSKILKKYLSSEKDSTRNGSFMIIPAVGYAPETGVEYGIASTYNFFADKSNPNSRTSNVTFMATLTTKSQKNIKLNTDIWTKDNDYHIVSELRYRDWPINFYGLGNSTQFIDEDRIGQKLIRAKFDVEKKITSKLYAGLNLQYDNIKIEDLETEGLFEREQLIGKKGGQYLAIGTSLLMDDRDYTTYTTKGHYIRLRYAYAPDFWQGDNFSGNLLELDGRYFYSPVPKITLAGQLVYRGTFGQQAPFYVYRELGGDNTMRGYYLGRYRDKNYATMQTELRYRAFSRFGAVIFGGLGSTFSSEYNIRAVPSYGLGLRYFFSLEHNSSVRFDYAIGEQRAGEKRQKGFYISLSEAF